MFDADISRAWAEVGTALRIRVVAPFVVPRPDGGELRLEAFLSDFGGPRGIVVTSADPAELGEIEATGYRVSRLGASYRIFRREPFASTLDDWGWHGRAADRPSWYTGRSWG